MSLLKLVLLMVTIWVLLIIGLTIETEFQSYEKEEACKDIGMKYKYIGGIDRCYDEDVIKTVIIECKGLLWKKSCKASIMKIE